MNFIRRILPSWRLVHFGLSSCGCMVIDKLVFSLCNLLLINALGRCVSVAIAIVCARMVSGHCNYFYNQRVVFKSHSKKSSYIQYWGLVLVNMVAAMCLTELVTLWLDVFGLLITAVNFCVDVVLFGFSYTIQRVFIFKGNQ